MKFVVLVRQVPDPNAVRFDARAGEIVGGTAQAPNEYDLVAMEAAIQLQESGKADEVVVMSVGPAKEALNRCLAMGADRAVAIDLPNSTTIDGRATSQVLAAALKSEAFDLILMGQETSDSGTGSVGPELSAALDLPFASNVVGLETTDGSLTAQREVEEGRQVVELQLPAIVCTLTGLNEPRYPSLKGIMAARRKPTATKSVADLGIDASSLESSVTWGKLFQEEESGEGIILRDVAAAEAVDQLVAFLTERKLLQ